MNDTTRAASDMARGDTPEPDVTVLLREKGVCGALSPDGEHACLLTANHGRHGWEQVNPEAVVMAVAFSMQARWRPEDAAVIKQAVAVIEGNYWQEFSHE